MTDKGLPDAPSPVRFPALRKITSFRRAQRIPFVQQLEAADCGAACLAMVLRYYGREVSLDDARRMVGTGRAGASALAILRGGERFGLRGRGLRFEVDDLAFVPRGTILHWSFNHFVVFDGHSPRGVFIVDPSAGRRFVRMERFRKQFTGVGLTLEPSETFERTSPGKSRLWVYFKRLFEERGVLGRIVTVSLILRLFALSLPILTGLIVDRVVPRSDHRLLLVVGAGLGVMLVFQFLSSVIRAHLILQIRTNLDTKMTLGFVDYLVDLPYAFFQRRSTGDLLMRVNSNATIREIMSTNMLSGLLDGSLVLLYLALLFLLSVPLGLLVLGLGVVQILVFLLSRHRYTELMSELLEIQARSRSYLVELLAGMETLKSVGGEHRGVERWSNLFVDEVNASLRRGRLSAYVDALNDALRVGSPLLILSVGAILVMGGHLSLGTMLALNALAVGFLTPLSSLVGSGLQVQLLRSYIERIDDVIMNEPEQDRTQVAAAPTLTGAISVEEVSFRYDANAPQVIRNVSLEITPGERVAIVGRSGSGKSTLAALLVGLYPPTHGRVQYDGQDLRRLELRSVRRQLGIVPQHPYIFGGSIRQNIALGSPNASLEQIMEAARQACIHDDIVAMGMGYETLLADGGASLSGGQRQRLALARALVHRPAIILLDEATSSLDTETESRVMQNLDAMRCTRLIIAHRLSTIMDADVIVVMENGRIVEKGTHVELLGKRGVYRDLVAAQAGLERKVKAP